MIKFAFPENITTERLVLQRLRYEDAEEIFYAYASKPIATRYVSWQTHRTTEDTRQFLRYARHAWNEHKDYSYSVRLKNSNRLIGSFGIINDNGNIQFGYIYSPTQWNKGYASEVCQAMLPLIKTVGGAKKIFTYVAIENGASSRVLEKSGLQPERKMKFLFPNLGPEPIDCIVYRYF